MNLKTFRDRITKAPFMLSDGLYHIDDSQFEESFQELESFLLSKHLRYSDHKQAILDKIHAHLDVLRQITIKEADVNTLNATGNRKGDLATLDDARLQLQVLMAPLKAMLSGTNDYDYSRSVAALEGFNNTVTDSTNNQKKRVVLNKNNPFASVEIRSNTYLYPDQNNQFRKLSFLSGHRLQKQTVESTDYVTLAPSFEIVDSKMNQDSNSSSIILSDDVSRKLPTTAEGQTLYYF